MPRKKKAEARPAAPNIIIEGAINNVQRVRTNLFGLDYALGGGVPLRTGTELFGFTHVGKSTIGYHILFAVAARLGDFVGILDTEGYDAAFITESAKRSGFSGTIWFVPVSDTRGGVLDDGDRLDLLRVKLRETDGYSGQLLDSVGNLAIASTLEGSVKEAKMGQRAKIMNEYMRATIADMRTHKTPFIHIQTNHAHPVLNGQGTTTSGGLGSAFGCAQRIRLSAAKREEDGTLITQGIVEKLRFRTAETGHRAAFEIVMLPGYGVHVGLTAVQDCINFGLAKLDRTVTLKGKSYGFMSKLRENKDDPDVFQPFINELTSYFGG